MYIDFKNPNGPGQAASQTDFSKEEGLPAWIFQIGVAPPPLPDNTTRVYSVVCALYLVFVLLASWSCACSVILPFVTIPRLSQRPSL